jgi:serine/threonine protein kinase
MLTLFPGAFGEVRKCVNKKTGAVRAVKIMRKDALDPSEKERFFAEIEILKHLVSLNSLTQSGSPKHRSSI